MSPRQLLVALLCVSSAGCFSWDRRKPLVPADIKADLPAHAEDDIVVYFQEVVPGHPLPEVIWDNAVGPSWDVAESNLIGFTQNYTVTPILLPPFATATTTIHTRLVMPFGRCFSAAFESGLQKAYPRHTTCFDASCVEQALASDAAADVVRVTLDSFFTWESPTNHLNYYVTGTSSRAHRDGTVVSDYQFAKKSLQESVGGFFSTHSAIIDAMNEQLNRFVEELAIEVVTKGCAPASSPD